MKIIRVRSTEFIKRIKKHLIFTDPAIRGAFIGELEQRMIQLPDSVLILAAIDGDDILAYMIAQNPGPKIPYVVVAQAWSDSVSIQGMDKEFLTRLVLWATSLGKEYIRAETQRNPDALYRAFGFKPIAQVVRLDFNSDRLHNLLVEHSAEIL